MTPPDLLSTSARRGLAALALLALAGGAGCRERPDAPIGAMGPMTPQQLEEVPVPAAEAPSEEARERLAAARRGFDERLATPGIPPIGKGRAYGQLGLVYHAYDFDEAAAAAYRNAAKLDPKNYRWPYLLGVLARRADDLAAAREGFERAAELRPDDAATLVALGELELEAGRPELAAERFAAALELSPDEPALHALLATAYQAAGDGERAAEHRELAGDAPPRPTDPLLARVAGQRWGTEVIRARRALDGGDPAAAAELAQAALPAAPDDANLHLVLATALAKLGREEEAVRHFEEILRTADDPAARKTAHVNLAVKLRAEERIAEAAEQFRGAVAADPDDKQVILALALMLQKLGRYDEAAGYCRRAVEIDPTMAPAQFGLARNLALAGRWAETRQALEAVQSSLRDNPVFVNRLARVLAAAPDGEVRDGARALELAERSYQRGDNAEAAETLAMALAELGRFDEAIRYQEQAIEKSAALEGSERLERLQANLELYRQGRPSRDPAV